MWTHNAMCAQCAQCAHTYFLCEQTTFPMGTHKLFMWTHILGWLRKSATANATKNNFHVVLKTEGKTQLWWGALRAWIVFWEGASFIDSSMETRNIFQVNRSLQRISLWPAIGISNRKPLVFVQTVWSLRKTLIAQTTDWSLQKTLHKQLRSVNEDKKGKTFSSRYSEDVI